MHIELEAWLQWAQGIVNLLKRQYIALFRQE